MTARQRETIDMLNDPDRWPLWPVLPVRLVTETGADRPTVFGFIYDPDFIIPGETAERCKPVVVRLGFNKWAAHPELIADAVKEEYDSAEAVVAAGWLVD